MHHLSVPSQNGQAHIPCFSFISLYVGQFMINPKLCNNPTKNQERKQKQIKSKQSLQQ
jgi:hypothetical protein